MGLIDGVKTVILKVNLHRVTGNWKRTAPEFLSCQIKLYMTKYFHLSFKLIWQFV